MKFAIIIPTYRRNDGKTIEFLERSIDSIFSQTYQKFKIFLIGDKYDNESEVYNLIEKYDKLKIFFKNLKIAKERDIYDDKWAIWSYGGVNATNVGIEYAIDENFDFICHLDHDDWWFDNHLEEIKKCIDKTKCDWMCTKSTYRNINTHFPPIQTNEKYLEFLPTPERVIHSSVCFNIKTLPLRYVDIFTIEGKSGLPADAYLWKRQNKYIRDNNLKSILINTLTCNHLEEGYTRKNI
jgi:glycosyltransferase involved in cell wall biosynthesis